MGLLWEKGTVRLILSGMSHPASSWCWRPVQETCPPWRRSGSTGCCVRKGHRCVCVHLCDRGGPCLSCTWATNQSCGLAALWHSESSNASGSMIAPVTPKDSFLQPWRQYVGKSLILMSPGNFLEVIWTLGTWREGEENVLGLLHVCMGESAAEGWGHS